MNNQKLLIYEFQELTKILNELNDVIKFNIINVDSSLVNSSNLLKDNNYLIVTKNQLPNLENQVVLKKIPINIFKFIEKLNIEFLKNKFNHQSEFDIGDYKINLNSREMFSKSKKLKLTEKETNIILYLFNFKKPVKIELLQSEVWGYKNDVETHTVETHIYRLRKKILEKFKDSNFIISTQNGYQIS